MPLNDDALIADFLIQERLDLSDKRVMTITEAIDQHGVVHPELRKRLPLATEVRICIDCVRITRHMTQGELKALMGELEGDSK